MLFFSEVHEFFVLGSGGEFFEGNGGSFNEGDSLCFELLVFFLDIGDHLLDPGHFEVELVESIPEFEDHFFALLFGYSKVVNDGVETTDLLDFFRDLVLLFLNGFLVLISEQD